jgi:hypothetical protein
MERKTASSSLLNLKSFKYTEGDLIKGILAVSEEVYIDKQKILLKFINSMDIKIHETNTGSIINLDLLTLNQLKKLYNFSVRLWMMQIIYTNEV